jgi:C-terminal processing protease CtpA/Prc
LSFKEFAPSFTQLRLLFLAVMGAAIMFLASQPLFAQAVAKEERERGQKILQTIKNDIKDKYYDPAFRGIDIEARFKLAAEKIEQATTPGHINGIIAQVLLDLNDSHTFFIPPPWAFRVDYGWEMQTFGDKCYVTRVEPNSDAKAKGLRVGDEVYSVDGIWLTPKNFWKFKYMYNTLRPKTRMQVVVQRPDGQQEQLDIAAQVTPGKAKLSIREFIIDELIEELGDANSYPRYKEVGDDLIIWKIPEFDLGEKAVDEMMKKVKGRKSLILDLRGNPGGYVIALQRLAGYFFDHDVKIADMKLRGSTKEMKAKTRGKDKVFTGKLVVLVDSESGSAAEILARLIQIEKRGTVLGDHTPGKVMRSRVYQHEIGPMTKLVFFALSITNADLIMGDGKSLESSGVAPDELVLPTPADLAAHRDPVLSRAAAIVGVEIEPEEAASFFPRLRRLTFEEVEEEKEKDKKDKFEKKPQVKNPYVELPHLSP